MYIYVVILVIFLVYRYVRNKNNLFNGLGKIDKSRPPKLRIVYSRKQLPKDRQKIVSSRDANSVFRKIWSNQVEIREEMYVLFLNRKNMVLGYHILSMGGITGTVADKRLLFAVALNSLATSIIIAHNHPSGNITPSAEDKELTKEVKKTGELMNITLLDHLIIGGDNNYFSFADEGEM